MFQGFTEKTGQFLWGLALNNERPWFEAHKEEFLETLKRPFDELARDTYGLMTEAWPKENWQLHISRIYRDARRLFGRGPYKEHLWFSVKSWDGLLSGPMFWFEVGAADWGCGMGFYDASPAQMEAYRASILAEPARFKRIVNALDRQKRFTPDLPAYARPKGSIDPKLDPWFNARRVGMERHENFGGDLFSPELPRLLAEDYKTLLPLYRYLCRFCTPEEKP